MQMGELKEIIIKVYADMAAKTKQHMEAQRDTEFRDVAGYRQCSAKVEMERD